MAAPQILAFTVKDAMIACQVDDTNVFDNETAATRLARDLFDNDFSSCMDKTHEELDLDFKSYSELTQAQGQIRLFPGVKRNIKAFVQWTRDCIRQGDDPTTVPFPANDVATLMRRYKTHNVFISKSKTLSDAAKPSQFTSKVKWEDWAPTFLNFLRSIPGRDGVPLLYICRDYDAPNYTPQQDFLMEYVLRAPLIGEAFVTDSSEVHTYLVNFITGNSTAESKVQPLAAHKNGRLDFIALKDHYEGIGVNAIDVLRADKILDSLFYAGEKKPHMWWEEFERQLTSAFTTYDKKEGRKVHSNEMKLRILCRKVNADFLQHSKAAIMVEMTKIPMTMTYDQALANFRNQVNNKFSPELSSNKVRRSINQTQSSGRGGFGRGGFGRGGRGFGGRGHGRGGRNHSNSGRGNTFAGMRRQRQDSTFLTLTDGSVVEYHPSFKFPPHVFEKMKESDKQMLYDQRANYRRSRQAQQFQTYPNQQWHNPYPPPPHVPQLMIQASTDPPQSSQISQITQQTTRDTQLSLPPLPPGNPPHVSAGPSSIMGGRNEQAQLHGPGQRPR